MKTIILTPKQRSIFVSVLVILFLVLTHFGAGPVLQYLRSNLPPLLQLLVFVAFLAFAGILAGLSKIRGAGFSGQYSEQNHQYWKSLEIIISPAGSIYFLGFILKILTFSVLFYAVVKVLNWYFFEPA